MRNVGLKVFVAICAGAIAGCDCNPPKERELFLTFNKPVDGQQLTANDDLDATAPGLQLDVEVKVLDQELDELGGVALALRSFDVELLAENVDDLPHRPRAVDQFHDALAHLRHPAVALLEGVERVVGPGGEQPASDAIDSGLRVHPGHAFEERVHHRRTHS